MAQSERSSTSKSVARYQSYSWKGEVHERCQQRVESFGVCRRVVICFVEFQALLHVTMHVRRKPIHLVLKSSLGVSLGRQTYRTEELGIVAFGNDCTFAVLAQNFSDCVVCCDELLSVLRVYSVFLSSGQIVHGNPFMSEDVMSASLLVLSAS